MEFPLPADDEVDYYGIGLHSHYLLLAGAGTHKRHVELLVEAADPHSLPGYRAGSEVGLYSGLTDWGVE